MALCIPDEAIASHWSAALRASRRRRPLEDFLRARGLSVASHGPTREADNLICASLHFLECGLQAHAAGQALPAPAATHYIALAQIGAAVAESLSTLIDRQAYWSIAASAAITDWLAARMGGPAAARMAVTAARRCAGRPRTGVADARLRAIKERVIRAVTHDEGGHAAAAAAVIAEAIAAIP